MARIAPVSRLTFHAARFAQRTVRRVHPALLPVRVRALLALGAGAAGGAVVELAGTRLAVAGLAGLAGLVALLRWWPASATALLLIAAALNRFIVPGGGANIKPEHVATVVVLGLLIARAALRSSPTSGASTQYAIRNTQYAVRSTFPRWRLGSALALAGLGAYLGANLLASLTNAPQPGDSLRLVGLITLVSIPYLLVVNLVTGRAALRQALLLWLAIGLAEALSGLGIMLLWQRFGLDLGVQQVLGAPPVPVGTLREGNIFGSYTAAVAVGLLALLLTTSRRRSLLLGSAVGLVLLAGLAISLSRGAWLGFVVGAAFVGLVRAGMLVRRGAGVVVLLAVLLPALVGVLSVSGSAPALGPLAERLATLDFGTLANDTTVVERLDTYAKAQEGIALHPVIGNGTGSFGQRYVFLSVDEPAWVGNLELHLLYDSGLIGVAGFWLCLGAVGWRAARAYRRTRDPLLRGALLGLGGGLLALLVAYQATEATWLAFTWVHLGLLAAASAIALAPPVVYSVSAEDILIAASPL